MYNILSFSQKSKLVPQTTILEFSLLIKMSLHAFFFSEVLAALDRVL